MKSVNNNSTTFFIFVLEIALSHVRWRSMDCQFPTEVFHNFELECIIFCRGLKHLDKARVTLCWKGKECELYKLQNDYFTDDSWWIGLLPRISCFAITRKWTSFYSGHCNCLSCNCWIWKDHLQKNTVVKILRLLR